MWTHLKRWWATEGAMVQLRGLDNRLLADMGLDRDGLRKRVRGEVHAPSVAPEGAGAGAAVPDAT